jgi:hypothetical protein
LHIMKITATHIQIQQLANLSTNGYFKSVDGEGLSHSEFSQSNTHLLFMQGHINLIHIHTISLLITVLVWIQVVKTAICGSRKNQAQKFVLVRELALHFQTSYSLKFNAQWSRHYWWLNYNSQTLS